MKCEDCGEAKPDVRPVILEDEEHRDDVYWRDLCKECERRRW